MTRLAIAAALLVGAWWAIMRGLETAARNLFGENDA